MMIRVMILLMFAWGMFSVLNMFFIGAVSAKCKAKEETKHRWFLLAIMGGPIFTIFSFLIYLMFSVEKYYEDKEKKRNRQSMKDMFEDES